jgi:hypothetical protein
MGSTYKLNIYLLLVQIFGMLGCAYNASNQGCSPANVEWRTPKRTTSLVYDGQRKMLTFDFDGALYDLNLRAGEIERVPLGTGAGEEARLALWPNKGADEDSLIYLSTEGRSPSCCETEIYLLNRAAKVAKPITHSGRGKWGLRVSGDGKRALYLQASRRRDPHYIPFISLKDWVGWKVHILDLQSREDREIGAVSSDAPFAVLWAGTDAVVILKPGEKEEEETALMLSAQTGEIVKTFPREFVLRSDAGPGVCGPLYLDAQSAILSDGKLLLATWCQPGGPGTDTDIGQIVLYDPRSKRLTHTTGLKMANFLTAPEISEESQLAYYALERRNPSRDRFALEIWSLDLRTMKLTFVSRIGVIDFRTLKSFVGATLEG